MVDEYDILSDNAIDGIASSTVQGAFIGTVNAMSAPSESNKGASVLYIGETDTYVHGTFYRSNGIIWEPIRVRGFGNDSVSIMVGDGVHESFLLTHGLNTLNFTYSIRTNDEHMEYVDAVMKAVDVNTARVTFSTVIGVDSVIVVMNAGGDARSSDSVAIPQSTADDPVYTVRVPSAKHSAIVHEVYTPGYRGIQVADACSKRCPKAIATDSGDVRTVAPHIESYDEHIVKVSDWVPLMGFVDYITANASSLIDVDGDFDGKVTIAIHPYIAHTRSNGTVTSWDVCYESSDDCMNGMKCTITYSKGIAIDAEGPECVPGIANVDDDAFDGMVEVTFYATIASAESDTF